VVEKPEEFPVREEKNEGEAAKAGRQGWLGPRVKALLRSKLLELAPLILALVVLGLKLMIINTPGPDPGGGKGFVFDEAHYIPAIRQMLNGSAANNEHPPLSKALMMLGVIVFGDNPVGWRITIVISDAVSVALLYYVTLELTKNKLLASASSLFFAADVMSFNIGQMAILDAPAMAFSLAMVFFFLKKRHILGSIFLGLAFLCKLTSIFILVGLLAYLFLSKPLRKGELTKHLGEWIEVLEKYFFIGLIVGMLGLWVYDSHYRAFNTPLEHLDFMLSYHSSLKYQNASEVVFPLPIPPGSLTNSWITYFPPAAYFVTTVTESANSQVVKEYHPIAYYGIYSPIWWTIWALVPIGLYELYRYFRCGEVSKVDFFILMWVAATFLPNVVFAYVMQRWVYTFYFYDVIPALCVGVSYYLTRPGVPKITIVIVTAVQLFWFFNFFPVRSKLHTDILLSLGLRA